MAARFPLLLRLVAAAAIALPPVLSAPAARAQDPTNDCRLDEAALALDATEQAMLEQINAYRAGFGLGALEPSTVLARSAQWKSVFRASGQGDPDSHDDPNRTWDQRIIDCGYDAFALMGENLGRIGGATDEIGTLFAAWQASPIHDEVMRTAGFRAIGIARVVDSAGVSYWTTVFGSLTDSELPNAPPAATAQPSGDAPATEPAPEPPIDSPADAPPPAEPLQDPPAEA